MWNFIIPAAAGVASSVIGANQARGAQESADAKRREALALLAGVDIPDKESLLYNYDSTMIPQSVGELEYLAEQAVDVGPSAYEDISIDPRLRQEQIRAMDLYGEMADRGLTEADLAAIEDQRRASEAASQSRQRSIIQEMQQRGQGGAGAEMAARLKAAQMASEADAASGRDIAKQALERKIKGAQLLADQSGNLRRQDYAEQEGLASAKDALERFKNQNLQGVRQRNVSAQRDVQAGNLQNSQRIADAAANLRARQEERRVKAEQDDYNNRIRRAQSQANVLSGVASQAEDAAERRAGLASDIGGAIAGGLTNYFGSKK